MSAVEALQAVKVVLCVLQTKLEDVIQCPQQTVKHERMNFSKAAAAEATRAVTCSKQREARDNNTFCESCRLTVQVEQILEDE